jgi:hypothetical protein
MPAGDDHDVRRFGYREACCGALEIFRDYLVSIGKALPTCVRFAIIDDGDIETGVTGSPADVKGNVSRTEEVERRRRQDRFKEDVERSSTDQTCVVLRVLIQIEGKCTRLFGLHDLAGGLPDFRLDASAANRA